MINQIIQNFYKSISELTRDVSDKQVILNNKRQQFNLLKNKNNTLKNKLIDIENSYLKLNNEYTNLNLEYEHNLEAEKTNIKRKQELTNKYELLQNKNKELIAKNINLDKENTELVQSFIEEQKMLDTKLNEINKRIKDLRTKSFNNFQLCDSKYNFIITLPDTNDTLYIFNTIKNDLQKILCNNMFRFMNFLNESTNANNINNNTSTYNRTYCINLQNLLKKKKIYIEKEQKFNFQNNNYTFEMDKRYENTFNDWIISNFTNIFTIDKNKYKNTQLSYIVFNTEYKILFNYFKESELFNFIKDFTYYKFIIFVYYLCYNGDITSNNSIFQRR